MQQKIMHHLESVGLVNWDVKETRKFVTMFCHLGYQLLTNVGALDWCDGVFCIQSVTAEEELWFLNILIYLNNKCTLHLNQCIQVI